MSNRRASGRIVGLAHLRPATVQVHDSYAVQRCSTRLLTPIQRNLAGIAGHDLALTFTT